MLPICGKPRLRSCTRDIVGYEAFEKYLGHCAAVLSTRAEFYVEQQRKNLRKVEEFDAAVRLIFSALLVVLWPALIVSKHQVAAAKAASGGTALYRAVKPMTVRLGADLGSRKVTTLKEGEVFEALEERRVGDRPRIRMAHGWISPTSISVMQPSTMQR